MSTRGFVGYKHKNIIKGWYNSSDSYPESGLGEDILEKVYCHYTWDVIKSFFLKKLKLTKKEKDHDNHRDILNIDWKKDSITLLDGEEFYKDGLFCEYAYIFDLDSPVKKLLFFKGFGNKPSKGYEDWFYRSPDSKKEVFYENYVGNLINELPLVIATGIMLLFYKDEHIYKTLITGLENLPTLLGKALITGLENLPTLLGINETIDSIVDYRLKNSFSLSGKMLITLKKKSSSKS